MEFKTNISFNFKTSIKCPKCGETFDKPADPDSPPRCTHCGAQLNLSKESLDDAMREVESRVAGTLGKIGIPLPPNYADIARAKSLSKILNISGVLAAIWTFFFPHPYIVAILVCSFVPVAAVLLMYSLKGVINFETKKKKSEEPYLTFALIAPPLALAWRGLSDFHILFFNNVWIPTAAVGIVFSIMIFSFSADVKRKPAYLIVTLIFGLVYGYGLTIEANCLPDRAAPRTYTAKVLGKRTSYSSRSNSYYINVTPWGPKTEEHEISIKKKGYEIIKVNDEISIHLREGMLGIPWYFIQMKR